jgi:hypothetical protein
MTPKLLPAAVLAAMLATPAMALEARECGQLAIATGEAERASALCPDDAKFFEQKADWLNTVMGNLCGQYDHEAMSAALITGAALVVAAMAKDGVQVMCDKLRAALLEEDKNE